MKGSPLAGRSVLVSGAASGIGRQLATDLYLRESCGLILVDIDLDGLRGLQAELERTHTDLPILIHPVDIGSTESVAALAEGLRAAPIDILVNNAGILHLGPFARTDVADFERVVNVNLLGTVRMTRAFLPKLLERRGAFIVNVASAAGLAGAPGMCGYSASKFGIVGFSEALRAELRGRVGVAAVCPTWVRTNIVKKAGLAEGPATGRCEAIERTLWKLGTTVEKVSRAILRTIRRRKKLELVTLDAHLIYHLHRLWPGLCDFAVHVVYRRLLKEGVLIE